MFIHVIKKLVALTPYRISRAAANRFEEIHHCLRHIQQLGFEPLSIVDAGAHLGSFSLSAHKIFPNARIHMIEPQPACHAGLEVLQEAHGFELHKVALADRPGQAELVFGGMPDTGAHLGGRVQGEEKSVTITTATLDDLLVSEIGARDRTLLKLDLQGHELKALQGASKLLPRIEMVIAEVSFFQQEDEPKIPELIRFFDERGFDLFDVAGLAGRTRDGRLRQGDFLFVQRGSRLWNDKSWN